LSVVGTAGGGYVQGVGCADFEGVAIEDGDDGTGEVRAHLRYRLVDPTDMAVAGC
jgi:hypothetical protein